MAQNEQFPKHPLELIILNFTSSKAGIPPASLYDGWYSLVYGSAYTASSSSLFKITSGLLTTSILSPWSWTIVLPLIGSCSWYVTLKACA